jgi:hypothetical protein
MRPAILAMLYSTGVSGLLAATPGQRSLDPNRFVVAQSPMHPIDSVVSSLMSPTVTDGLGLVAVASVASLTALTAAQMGREMLVWISIIVAIETLDLTRSRSVSASAPSSSAGQRNWSERARAAAAIEAQETELYEGSNVALATSSLCAQDGCILDYGLPGMQCIEMERKDGRVEWLCV